MSVVAKGGGTSLATPESSTQFTTHLEHDGFDQQYMDIVVSGPGARYKGDRKLTDLLAEYYTLRENSGDLTGFKAEILGRIALFGQDSLVDEFAADLEATGSAATRAFIMSRGEHYGARAYAVEHGLTFKDSSELVFFDELNQLDEERTSAAISSWERERPSDPVVIPGYYGTGHDGSVRVFPRGGSDITAGILTRFRPVNEVLHVNMTDRDGVRSFDPEIMPDAERVEKIDYRELRSLGIGGAGIIHPRAVIHLSRSGGETWIMNTFNESPVPGTVVVPHREPEPGRTVLAISMRDDLRGFSTYFSGMDDEEGFSAACQAALKEYGYHYEGSTGDTDSTTFYLGLPEDTEPDEAVLKAEDLIRAQHPDVNEVKASRYGAVHVIGREISGNRNEVEGRIAEALGAVGINPLSSNADINSPGSVKYFRHEDTLSAASALYSEFFKESA